MNRSIVSLLSGLFLLATATNGHARPVPFEAQPYANVSIDGWTLLDGEAGSGERGFGLVDLGIDLELTERLAGHVGGFVFAGDRDVNGFTGDFGVYSNILTEARYTLFTAWLQHSFGDSYIRFGQLASDENFYVSEGGSLFLNSNFGAIPIVSANVAAPIFSVGSAGIEYRKNLGFGYVQTGAYAGDPGPGDRDDHGLKGSGGGDAGYFFLVERGWNYAATLQRQGTFKVGTYFHSGRFESFADESASNGNGGLYAIVDHPVSNSNGLFARIGVSPSSECNAVNPYFDLGINCVGVFENRPDDVFGIAYSNTQFAKAFRDASSTGDGRAPKREQVIEITYRTEIADRWQIQPSIQYILNPFYATEDAIVAGIRLSIGY